MLQYLRKVYTTHIRDTHLMYLALVTGEAASLGSIGHLLYKDPLMGDIATLPNINTGKHPKWGRKETCPK